MRPSLCLLFLLIFALPACKPKVLYFIAAPRIVSAKDSVRLSWRTRGKAEMIFYQSRITNPPGDSANMLDFLLVARKGEQTSAPYKQTVRLVSPQTRDVLSFSLTGREGDTIIATGTKDTTLYRGFAIVAMAGLMHRPIFAEHNGRTVLLPDSGITVTTMADLPYDGVWTLRTILTTREKSDRTLIPNTLDVITIIKPINH